MSRVCLKKDDKISFSSRDHNSRTKIIKEIKGEHVLWSWTYCDIDTCSDINLIEFKEYCKHSEETSKKLWKSKGQLKSFGWVNIKVIGEIVLECHIEAKNMIDNILLLSIVNNNN